MTAINRAVWLRYLHRLLTLFLVIGSVVLMLIGLIGFLCFQSQPLWTESFSINKISTVSKAQLVQKFTKARLLPRTLQGEAMGIELTLHEFNALFDDVAQRTLDAQAMLIPSPLQEVARHHDFKVLVSVPTTRTPLRKIIPNTWINLQTEWRVGPQGQVHLLKSTWGYLPLPVSWVSYVFDVVLQKYNIKKIFDILLQSISHIKIDQNKLAVRWHWNNALRVRTLAALFPGDNTERLHSYQLALGQQIESAKDSALSQGRTLSLIHVMRPMFKLAQQRTLVEQLIAADKIAKDGIPVNENRAVLLVLLAHSLGIDLAQYLPRTKNWPPSLAYHFTLRKRVDFAQHYLMSAFIAAVLGGPAAELLGVYKERSDKVAGSGFSFNDIAADKAGLRFGHRARYAAQDLQRRVQEGESEDFFMPDVTDMPEFLSAHDFEQQFNGKHFSAYGNLLKLIDNRVNQLGVLH